MAEFKIDSTKFKENVNNASKSFGKTAKDLFDAAVQIADQNDDGKFDFSDVSSVAESISENIKKGAQFVKASAEEKSKQLDLKALQPIFNETLYDANFAMPKFIRIVNRDKRYIESEACQGSIGYCSTQKGLNIVNIFTDSVNAFGLAFYPDNESDFYYVDPSERDRYIALNDYFNYLKVARVNELQKLAQDLGAKHFKVTYKEEISSFTERNIKSGLKAGVFGNANISHEYSEKQYSAVEIAAENTFDGHAPVQPQLKYLQKDPSIQNLIAMRMDENGTLYHQKFMIQLSQSSGMKETDAVKIDAILKGLKCSGNTTVASEAKNESKRYFEYEIEF